MVTTDSYNDWQLPPKLARLKDLAYNLWWSWHPEARALFKEIDRTLWAETHHNPVTMLRGVPAERLQALTTNAGFLERVELLLAQADHACEQARGLEGLVDVLDDGLAEQAGLPAGVELLDYELLVTTVHLLELDAGLGGKGVHEFAGLLGARAGLLAALLGGGRKRQQQGESQGSHDERIVAGAVGVKSLS